MARLPEIFYSSCLSTPPWVDDAMRRIREEQERIYEHEMFGVPQFKVSTGIFDNDYLKQPWITYDNYIKPNCIVKLEKETNKMEAKKCDRCGKLYEQENVKDLIDVLFSQEKVSNADKERFSEFHINEMRTHGIIVKKVNCGETVDFCPECRESFKKWFEES